jgi:signal transduction histidine kinase
VRCRRLDAEDRVRRAAAVAEAEVRQRLAEERLRIARDLHDALAHTISVIAVQVGNALDALDHGSGDARDALTIIRAASRQALAELRATLGLLRADESGAPETHPQPRLAQLPELVAQTKAAGVHVELRVEATTEALPPLVELTAFRVIQEALTNVIRHSAARSVAVTVRRDASGLVVQVSDDGPGSSGTASGPTSGAASGAAARAASGAAARAASGAAARAASGAAARAATRPPPATSTHGLGLVGMRERTETLGGTLTAGAAPSGGYRVTATLPP